MNKDGFRNSADRKLCRIAKELIRDSDIKNKSERRALVESAIDMGVAKESDVRFLCQETLSDISAEAYQKQLILDRL